MSFSLFTMPRLTQISIQLIDNAIVTLRWQNTKWGRATYETERDKAKGTWVCYKKMSQVNRCNNEESKVVEEKEG